MSKVLKLSQSDYRIQIRSGGYIILDTGVDDGTVVVTGNLEVRGKTTTVSSENTNITDNILMLNSGNTGDGISSANYYVSGIQIDRGNLPDAQFMFDDHNLHYDPILDQNIYGGFVLKTEVNLTNLALRSISTDGTTDFYFDLNSGANTQKILKIANAEGYEDYVTNNNDIPNKKYVDDQILLHTSNQILDSIVYFDTNDVEKSKVTTFAGGIIFSLNGNLVGSINDSGLTYNNVNISNNTIKTITGNIGLQAATPSDNIVLASNLTSSHSATISGEIHFNTATNDQLYQTVAGGSITLLSGDLGSINNMSIGATTSSTGKFTILSVIDSATIPSGNTSTRPESPQAGNIRYNTELKSFEGYNGSIWGTIGGGLQSSDIITSNYTALPNNLVRADSTGGPFSISLPENPNDGIVVGVIDVARTFSNFPVTIIPNTGATIENSTSLVIDISGASVSFVYIASSPTTGNWRLEETPQGQIGGIAGINKINNKIITVATTTNATPTTLTTDNSLPNTVNQLILENDSTYTFTILVTARRLDADDESAGYKFEGVIDRNATPASVAFVGVPIKTVLAEDSTAWDCNIIADTTNGALSIVATGESSKTIKWAAVCETAEITT